MNLIFIFICQGFLSHCEGTILWYIFSFILISVPAALKYDVIIIVHEQMDLFTIHFSFMSCLEARCKQVVDMCKSPRLNSV